MWSPYSRRECRRVRNPKHEYGRGAFLGLPCGEVNYGKEKQETDRGSGGQAQCREIHPVQCAGRRADIHRAGHPGHHPGQNLHGCDLAGQDVHIDRHRRHRTGQQGHHPVPDAGSGPDRHRYRGRDHLPGGREAGPGGRGRQGGGHAAALP